MKKSQEIIGLPVFSIVEGRKIGQVKDLVINPEEGRVEFILVSNGSWYVGARVLPYKAVMGVGEHAVTTESENLMAMINETSSANSLLQRNIEVKGNRLLTNKGNLIGVISEYQINEDSGKIVSLEYKSAQDETRIDIVQADDVLTYGADVVVIKEKAPNPDSPPSPQPFQREMRSPLSQPDTRIERTVPVQPSSPAFQTPSPAFQTPSQTVQAPSPEVQPPAPAIPAMQVSTPVVQAPPSPVVQPPSPVVQEPVPEVQAPSPAAPIPTPPVQAPVTSAAPQDGASLFKDRQKQFLLGKKVIQDIRDARGSVLIKAGTIVTEEVFNLADKQGKFIELSELSK